MLVADQYPSFVKYMGSKSKIIDFVIEGINEVRRNEQPVLDLFAGSASLAGAIGRKVPFYSNDIQKYSSILSTAYVSSWKAPGTPDIQTLVTQAQEIINQIREDIAHHMAPFSGEHGLSAFNEREASQRELLHSNFDHSWHLFLKYYSGTWWSVEQCAWIDALREVAERYKDHPIYDAILASLMFAMAYCSQGTGHYAQYRDANSNSSMNDILLYRKRDIVKYFTRKYEETLKSLGETSPHFDFKATATDFVDSLENFSGGVVYADPPYCFVHYSRFYHALETLVLYDYPELQIRGDSVVKGRYRIGRHQSPFCIASKVEKAFTDLFSAVSTGNSKLVLSYSNTGMIALDRLVEIANSIFPSKTLELLTIDHQHMTLGRTGLRHRDVKECLLLVK